MFMEIRSLHKADIKNALDLVWSVFQEFEAPDYSDQGISEFEGFINVYSITKMMDRNEIAFWGCYNNVSLVGVIAAIGKRHISLFFVQKEYHKQGIGRQLFQAMIDTCNNDDDIKRFTVNSSPYATEVYHRLGFVDTDEEKTVNGIRFTPMEYLIV